MGTSSANGFFLAVPKSLDVSSGSARGTNKLALGIGVRAPAGGARVAVSVRLPRHPRPGRGHRPGRGPRGLFPVTVDRSVDPYRYGTITVRWNGQGVTHRFYIY